MKLLFFEYGFHFGPIRNIKVHVPHLRATIRGVLFRDKNAQYVHYGIYTCCATIYNTTQYYAYSEFFENDDNNNNNNGWEENHARCSNSVNH